VRILYFAWLRERIGIAEENVTPPEHVHDIAGLIEWLSTRDEGYEHAFSDLTKLRAAIDQEHVQFSASIMGAGEIAFFPPVTGG
jgi:molybdopterin synthase sulfur carrier subunit